MVTVKEAIKRLRLMADGGTNFSKESNEACRMGAEALKEIEKRGAVNCGQLCEGNTTAGCGKPNGVPCKMSNVTVAKNETVADVAPVVHGKWIGVRNGKGICSHCNRLDSIDTLATHCRYCGAKMDGERREDV